MKPVPLYAWTLAIALVAAAPLQSHAQATTKEKTETGKTSSANGGKMASSDTKFLTNAAHGNMAEVEMGRLASERGGSDTVKQFGQRMVADHGKANDELKQLAQQKGLALPTDVDSKDRKAMDKLSKLSGAEFDKAYAKDMVRDHDKDVKEFQREAKKAHDADVRSWAAKTLPVLEEHQQQARQMSASMGGHTRMGSKEKKSSPSTGGSASPATAPSAGSR
jgi:putative membrane protein